MSLIEPTELYKMEACLPQLEIFSLWKLGFFWLLIDFNIGLDGVSGMHNTGGGGLQVFQNNTDVQLRF